MSVLHFFEIPALPLEKGTYLMDTNTGISGLLVHCEL